MPSEIVLTNDKHYNDIASAIRNKNGLSTLYKPSEMAEAINALVVGGTITLQDKTVNPSEETQTITHDTGYMGLGEVTVTPILTEVKTVTENGNVYPTTGKYLTRVTVSVPQGGEINNQNKSVNPTESQQSVTYDDGYTGLGTVTVGAISSTYVGSGITQRSSTDLTASGATVTVPAGYYSAQASKAVATGTAGTPTATKGTVSNHSISVTPSVTNTTGYITGSTKTGTAVTVSASELVSGKKEITANGDNIDVTNYAQVKVAIPGDTPTIDELTVTPTTSQQVFNSSSVTGYKPVTINAIPNASETPTLMLDGNVDSEDDWYLIGGMNTNDEVTAIPFYSSSGHITLMTPRWIWGDATTANVLSGKVFSSQNGLQLTGTMTNNGATGGTISTQGGTYTIPAGYTSGGTVTANIGTGSATAPASISGTSASVSTGTNTLTLSKTISVTPSVTAGYISSGTAGNSSVSLTASVTTKGATTYTPGTTNQTIASGTYLTGAQTIAGDSDLVAGNIKSGVQIFGVTGTYSGSGASLQTKSVSPTESEQEVTPDSGYDGLSKVTVGAISSTYVGSGIDRNDSTDLTGDYGVSAAGKYTVTAPAGYYESAATYSLTSKTASNITTSTSGGNLTVTWEQGFYGGGGKNIATVKSSSDLTASGATVTVPAGYYEEAASKSVASGSATGPSSLSGSSATISTGTNTITLTKTGVTTTPTVSAGYVSSATASTATVALTASVTVNPTPTASGATVTIPAGYYSTQTTKAVSTGSATAPASISGTSATVSTGTNTLTLTKTVSVTPSVTAGYVSAGTAGNSSVSLTASVTTKAAATITPTTSNQTIASGTYITGTQTISGDANLIASNIISTASIFGVQGSVVINKYYTGSSAPSSSLGNNGDIYLQS